MTAETMHAAFAAGQLSPVEVLQAVTARIAAANPALNAFVVMNPGALAAARESEARWLAGQPIGPLDGVPCTVKDLVDLAGFSTRRGSRTTSAAPVEEDAPISANLKAAGAVIIGKTTTTEFGWKSPGDCPLNGITRNPWNTAHTPGGSSAGAGAAAAAGFGPLHLGTDAGGSVRIPAAWCGVVGLKPSFGRVPQWPLGAFANVAVAGPLTRSVHDAALMLGALARFDWRDPFCLPAEPRDWPRDWTVGLEDGVHGWRVGLLRAPGFAAPLDTTGQAALTEAATRLEQAGAVVEEIAPDLPDTRAVFSRVWGVALARAVAGVPESSRGLLDPGLIQVAKAMAGTSADAMMAAEAARIAAAHAMARVHQTYDLVLCPTVPQSAPRVDAPVPDPLHALWTEWAPWTFLFNLTRQPAISVPMGRDANGLPRAVQLAAALYRDDLVLRGARAIERLGEPTLPASE
jgi:aspartyl-tRNA(Asn)/glutamyl-tRNA(Gln) amidotransferase subunit A